jgi:2-oxoglutarate ferredoxin oxidoreductase subunit alpha
VDSDHNPVNPLPEAPGVTGTNGGVSVDRTDRMVIRFAGDSGDGMQLAGNRFTDAVAIFGNDLATLPTFPAEIRAPAGTLPGVSSFQLQIADWDILTPGDRPGVLVAMNPAALKVHLQDLREDGILLINEEAFDERNLHKAGFETNPLDDGTLDGFDVHRVPMETLTKEAVKGSGVSGRAVLRSKNFLALGLLLWMFGRETDVTAEWVKKKFGRIEPVMNANLAALKAGYNYGITTESFARQIEVRPAALPPGTYTNVNGNAALSWGLVAASVLSGLPLFYASYPITPASEILHELVRHRNFGVKTFQAEDEIAAAGAALGAAFAGSLAVTGTSGPGLSLKGETISLAMITEMPMIIVDVQRGGPSTGLPTKPEQSDLFLAVWGRHGESPLPVVAASSPSDAFEVAIEAARIAVKYMTPVILLSDGYIATGSEPWRLPDVASLPSLEVPFATGPNAGDKFLPYLRDLQTMARRWAIPGMPGLEHRIGGLEKEEVTGNVSYDPANHQLMTDIRAWKVANIANDIPEVEVDDPDGADLLVLSWGSTYSAVKAGVGNARRKGVKVAYARIRYLSPLPPNMTTVLSSYDQVLIPEMNNGQLSRMVKAEFARPVISYSKVEGVPFQFGEISAKIMEIAGR